MLSRSYDPPYDRPLANVVAWNLAEWLHGDARLEKHVEVETELGTFGLPLVVTDPSGRKFAFECDGGNFQWDPLRDECRDALVLCSRAVAAVYRIRGQDLWYHERDCIYFVAKNDPSLFSERLADALEELGSPEIKKAMAAAADPADKGSPRSPWDSRGHISVRERCHGCTAFYGSGRSETDFAVSFTRQTVEDFRHLEPYWAALKEAEGLSLDEAVERIRISIARKRR